MTPNELKTGVEQTPKKETELWHQMNWRRMQNKLLRRHVVYINNVSMENFKLKHVHKEVYLEM
jgi:hypothetical protein